MDEQIDDTEFAALMREGEAVLTAPLITMPDLLATIGSAEAARMLAAATGLTIAGAEEARAAERELVRLGEEIATVKRQARSILDPLNEARQAALDRQREALAPLEAADELIRRALAAWRMAERTRARELEARLQREAEERERVEREAAAAERREAGDDAGAQRVLSMPSFAPPVTVPTVKSKDVGDRVVWRAELVDFDALLAAIVAKRAPRALLENAKGEPLINQAALDALARGFKSTFDVPGCRAFEELEIVRRGKRGKVPPSEGETK